MTGELEFRTATQLGVSWPERTIELVVMPYESPATVVVRGRVVTEIVERGAFDGIDRRPNRVRVNRDHDVTRTVGRATRLNPTRPEGLVAEVRIARTPLGDETLALASDEILDASAGFQIMPNGERWSDNRTVRHLSRIWLGHIALTPDPAYETANVLAVRSRSTEPESVELGTSRTPNLDAVRLWQYEQRFERWEHNA